MTINEINCIDRNNGNNRIIFKSPSFNIWNKIQTLMFCSCLNHLQGRNCQFRHEPSALGSQTICPRWQQGKCYISRCNMRHANLNNQRRHSDSRPRFARTSPKADASEFQVKNIEEIRQEKRQRFGQPAELLKATDCNVTTSSLRLQLGHFAVQLK